MIDRLVAVGLIGIGVTQALVGGLMLIDPAAFYARIAPFPPPNGHFIRDAGTFELSFGLALLWSLRHVRWRTPVLGLGLLQFTLHSVNHLVDIDATVPSSKGLENFILITVGAVVLALILLAERTRARRIDPTG